MDRSPRPFADDARAAGASARREHARRRSARETRTRHSHPHLGGLLVALRQPPQHETAWERGAEGERRVATALDKYLDPGIALLHDRAIPGRRSNIDHIAVAPSGVWVIDSKRYMGKVELRRPLFGKAKLVIAGRDQTKLVDGVTSQIEHVRAAVGDVPVYGALCFVDADLPLVRLLEVDQVVLAYPRRLAKVIHRAGPLRDDQIRELATRLDASFPMR